MIVLESSSVPKSESEDKDWQRVSTKKQNHKRLNNPDVSQPSDSSSRVFCLSGDFGIQNTLLQMGLKIETPDGVRIHHLSTFGLKCAGCFKVTRKVRRICIVLSWNDRENREKRSFVEIAVIQLCIKYGSRLESVALK